MNVEEPYDQSLTYGQVARRRSSTPSGVPAVTGYYPNVRGQIQGPVEIGPVFDNLYRSTVVGSLDYGTEKIDQHPWLDVTATWTPSKYQDRPSGVEDPLTDGPPQPTIRDLSLHYRRERGASVTQYQNVPGRRFPANGVQDGVTWTYYQNVRAALQPYDPSMTMNGQMPDTFSALPPSPAHGWTQRPAQNAQAASNTKAADLVQQQSPHQDRLANSTYAGQTYSQTTAYAGQSVEGTGSGTVHSRRRRG